MKRIIVISSIGLMMMMPQKVGSQSIKTTKHNLSVSGLGTVVAQSETEICIFCHTPHNSNGPARPLWNRADNGTTYNLYASSTLKATVGQPDGTSILCLSCHDGTVALGSVLSRSTQISFGAITNMPAGRTNLGTNLADDHPISFDYTTALATADGQLKAPGSIVPPANLDHNSRMQCTSCHEAHDNTNGNFLVATTKNSALCFSCHDRNYWSTSSHNTSTKTFTTTNPWTHTPYTTVAENACENCHKPHTAGGPQRILNYLNEEDNCLNCHNGNVAAKNIQNEMTKTYKHNVFGYTGVHDPTENPMVANKHVECVDCHNPHAANSTVTATAPAVNGFTQGVVGIDANGAAINPAQNQYEICFKCHSDNPATQRYVIRYRGTGNRRLDFATTNVSFHPIENQGNNGTLTSLIAPLTPTSKIYCSDCHGSDDASAPAGPHGSSNPAMLKYAYDTTRFPKLGLGWTSAQLNSHWPLCFQCHNLSTVTTIHQAIHSGHFLKYTGCIVCHDAHGYDGTPDVSGGGNTGTAFTKLINFDTTVIRPNATNGKLIDIAGRKCYLVCHQYSTGTGGVYHAHRSTGSSF